jgi:hypothetical protein
MNKAQWVLLATLVASFYNVGTIWMVHFGWRLWPLVSPSDFGAYHLGWWAMIKPFIFPVAAVALLGSVVLIWWRPEGVTAVPVWLNVGLQLFTAALTIAFWGRWQGQTHFAKLPNGLLDPMYERSMSTHWIRATLITVNGFIVLWMAVQHLSSKAHTVAYAASVHG